MEKPKKKHMKKGTKIILIITGVVVVLFTILILVFIDMTHGLFIEHEPDPDTHEISKIIMTYEELYSDKWGLYNVHISDEEHSVYFDFDARYQSEKIRVWFELKEGSLDGSVLESMSEIYKAIVPPIREYLGSAYDSYPLEIAFFEPYVGNSIIITCTNNCDTVKLYFDCYYRIALKDIAEVFPEITGFEDDSYMRTIQYDSIEEIAGFENLQEVDFNVKLPEEEKEYILSIYPDCTIVEESYYKDK